MQTKICACLSMTIDGYIADQDNSVDYLYKVEGEGDNGYSDFYKDVDLIIMGGNTLRWLLDNGVRENPYKDKSVIIVTSEAIALDWEVAFCNNLDELKEIFDDYIKVWVVGGGQLISTMLNEQMINRLFVTIAPIILGDGVPLFKDIDQSIELKVMDVKQYNQFVELDYTVEYK